VGGTGHGGRGSDEDPPGGVGPSGLADSIALDQARGDPGLEARTAAYLDEQTRILRLQSGHIRQRHVLDLSHLRHRRWTDRLGLTVQALVIAAGLGIASLVAIAAWQAAHDRDLVIEPFSAAPELVARGVTGRVLATHLLDRLAALQDETDSLRAASSYRAAEPTDIKVESPETTLSLGEVKRYMVELLGRETRISGDAVRTPDGRLAVTARVGDRPGQVFQGADGDLDKMIDLSAEQVFCATQLYRCAVHLDGHGRRMEALAALDRLARIGAPTERLWALAAATAIQTETGEPARAIATARRGLAIDPNFVMLHWNLGAPYARLGWAEAELGELRATVRLLQHEQSDLDPARLAELHQAAAADLAAALGDYQGALEADNIAVSRALGDEISQARMRRLRDTIGLHDPAAQDLALAALTRQPPSPRMLARGGAVELATRRLMLILDRPAPTALPAAIADLQAARASDPASFAVGLNAPVLARGQVAAGDLAGAAATLAATPADCYFCAIARGELARAQGNAHGADTWFSRAAQLGPSLPFADEAWGRVELAREHLSVAPGRFASAVRRAPRWADPQKGWGDVMARQGEWRDALDHYDAALKLAPNWPALQQARATAAAHLR
jgi:tetratricopeptide (TPR) repeat protein